ncbi:hypothetical protein [Streptomyces sp. WG7]|uniref:hypothetical protein n=1 Tax=Streptomyces sp. WG7 TaxID=3417650 RepID=UPI003CF024C2
MTDERLLSIYLQSIQCSKTEDWTGGDNLAIVGGSWSGRTQSECEDSIRPVRTELMPMRVGTEDTTKSLLFQGTVGPTDNVDITLAALNIYATDFGASQWEEGSDAVTSGLHKLVMFAIDTGFSFGISEPELGRTIMELFSERVQPMLWKALPALRGSFDSLGVKLMHQPASEWFEIAGNDHLPLRFSDPENRWDYTVYYKVETGPPPG